MAIFAIADLHLDLSDNQKSMEIFGNRWKNYVRKLQSNWHHLITPNDTVVIPGDISWAIKLEEALPDLIWLQSLPGRKILMKGNHDFWWSTVTKIEKLFCENCINSIDILNNNAFEIENYILAGSRGWFTDRSIQSGTQITDYDKIIHRESIRLQLSLEHAVKLQQQSGKEILVFLHFPPIWNEFRCDAIIELLRRYQIHRCYFGHIHGCYTVPSMFEAEGIQFHIISADYLDFVPQIL